MAPALRPRITLLTAILLLCNLGLISILSMQWWQGSQRDSLLLMTPAAQLQVPKHHFSVVTGQDPAGDLQARAVFHASRSFYVAPAAATQVQQPPDYRLAGVIRLPNKPAAAILISNQAGARSKVVVGDQIEGWSIDDIRADRVQVSLNGQQAEIGARGTGGTGSMVPAVGVDAPGLTVVANSQRAQPKTSSSPASGNRVLSAPRSATSQAAQSAGGDPGGRLYRPPPTR